MRESLWTGYAEVTMPFLFSLSFIKYLLCAQYARRFSVKKQGLFLSWAYMLMEEETITKIRPNILHMRKWLSVNEKNLARKGHWECENGELK